jgi:hypothetical protein
VPATKWSEPSRAPLRRKSNPVTDLPVKRAEEATREEETPPLGAGMMKIVTAI